MSAIDSKPLKSILVLQCTIRDYRGKWKLGQNRPASAKA